MMADLFDPPLGNRDGATYEHESDYVRLNQQATAVWRAMRDREFCAERRLHYHVARVNTVKRMFLALASGADSVDGSSATRYAVTLPKLDLASRHRDMFAP